MTLSSPWYQLAPSINPLYTRCWATVYWRQIKDNSIAFRYISLCVGTITERFYVCNTAFATYMLYS